MVIRLEFRNRCYLQVYTFWILCINVTIMCLCFSYYVSAIIDSESGCGIE